MQQPASDGDGRAEASAGAGASLALHEGGRTDAASVGPSQSGNDGVSSVTSSSRPAIKVQLSNDSLAGAVQRESVPAQERAHGVYLRSFETEGNKRNLVSFARTEAAPFGLIPGLNLPLRHQGLPPSQLPNKRYHLRVTATPIVIPPADRGAAGAGAVPGGAPGAAPGAVGAVPGAGAIAPGAAPAPRYVVTAVPGNNGAQSSSAVVSPTTGSVVAHALSTRGHGPGLMVRPTAFEPWRPVVGPGGVANALPGEEGAAAAAVGLAGAAGGAPGLAGGGTEVPGEAVAALTDPATGGRDGVGHAFVHMYNGPKFAEASKLLLRSMRGPGAAPAAAGAAVPPETLMGRVLDSAALTAALDSNEQPREYSWIVPAGAGADLEDGLAVSVDGAGLAGIGSSSSESRTGGRKGAKDEGSSASTAAGSASTRRSAVRQPAAASGLRGFFARCIPEAPSGGRRQRRQSGLSSPSSRRRRRRSSGSAESAVERFFAAASDELHEVMAARSAAASSDVASAGSDEEGYEDEPLEYEERTLVQDVAIAEDGADDALGLPDALKPTVKHGGLEFAAPEFGGRLPPISYKLHAVEVHQFVPLPNAPNAWVIENGVNPTTNAVFGPVASPFDPAHTGMPAPTFARTREGEPTPVLPPEMARMFNRELPLTFQYDAGDSDAVAAAMQVNGRERTASVSV